MGELPVCTAPPAALVRDLCAAVGDLGGPQTSAERVWSLLRLLLLVLVLVGGAWLYWRSPLSGWSLAALLPAAVAYALLLIATHEMVHGTCLGLPRLEALLACLLSWPMAWPWATYQRLHRLHHRWTGCDPRDPERTELLPAERRRAGPLRRWIHRHLLVWRLLVLGGVGLIADTALKGRQLTGVDPGLIRARRVDAAGVLVVQALLIGVAIRYDVVGRYLLFWLVLERLIGAIVQFRGLVEHHGLWRRSACHLLTQLQVSRDVRCGAWFNALMGGLPNHCAHHAFPWIPSLRLPLARQRIDAVLRRHGAAPLPTLNGYGEAFRLLAGGCGVRLRDDAEWPGG